MDITQIVGIAAGTLTSFSMIPQLVKMIREKKAEKDVSVYMLIILMAGLATWVVYGIMKNDWPIIITNSFSFLVNIAILILRSVYKKN